MFVCGAGLEVTGLRLASYEAIVPFINMNYDGLKNAIIEILSGASI